MAPAQLTSPTVRLCTDDSNVDFQMHHNNTTDVLFTSSPPAPFNLPPLGHLYTCSTWPYICKQLYNVISKIDNFLNLGLPIAGCRNSVLIIASIMLVLTSLSFFRWYNTCACRFWNQKPFCKCSKSRSDRCKAGQCCSYWTVLRNWIRRTFDCRN
ncbi:hypothetical protein BsWGS_08984 [Bradybaena similaris]